MSQLDYKLLHALSVVIKDQSFEQAANTLCITQSAVSQRIKLLEQQFAEPVLIRKQPLEATPLGKKLLRHYRQVIQLETDLFTELHPEQKNPLTTLHIATNADSLATWLIPALAPLIEKYNIEFNMLVVDENRSHRKLRDGEAFGAISKLEKSVPGCHSVKLGNMKYVLVATPEFQQKYFAGGINSKSLKHAPGVTFDQKDNMHVNFIQRHFGLREGQYPLHAVRSSEAFVTMAKHGAGFCLVPELQIQDELAAGKLINILPEIDLVEPLYWHCWTLVKGVYKQTSDAIVLYAQQVLAND